MQGRDSVGTTGALCPASLDCPSKATSAEAPVAVHIQALLDRGEAASARRLFGGIVVRQQRRASRLAYHYLRDAAEADEAVQDAFVKAFFHIASFNPELSFEAWFTRILTNGCLDRRRARWRRERWVFSVRDLIDGGLHRHGRAPARGATPEEALLAGERRRLIAQAVTGLPGRQRMVFVLSHYGDQSIGDVATATGLKESTVRVHLFRAIRRLRTLLEEAL